MACRRDSTGEPRVDGAGGDYWLHYLGQPDPSMRGGERQAQASLAPEQVDVRDRVYTALLGHLGLGDAHKEALRERGLDDAAVDDGGYASLPAAAFDVRVQRLLDEFTVAELKEVPGLKYSERKGRDRYTKQRLELTHTSGLLVPVRNVDGRIVALKVRKDIDDDGPRYVYMSASREVDAEASTSGSHAHVPAFRPADFTTVRVTEGELKADVATQLSGVLTVSVPGVNSWRMALPVVKALGADRVVVAFDSDKATNEFVARAELGLMQGLSEEGYGVEVEEWDGHKGIDDALLAGAAVRRTRPKIATLFPTLAQQQQTGALVELAKIAYTFGVNQQEVPYAVPKTGPRWARVFKGGGFRADLANLFYEELGSVPQAQAMDSALLVLEGMSRREAPTDLPLRLARSRDRMVLDKGDDTGGAIIVEPGLWYEVERSPVLFRRNRLTRPLPVPVRGGRLDALREVLNVDDDSWPLVVAWLAAALIPDIPHPVGLLQGQQGSAKTTAAKMLISLIDSSAAPIRAQPDTETDWAAIGNSSYVVGIDNVSRIEPWWSDALCRASTGDAYTPRAYYQQEDVAVLSFRLAVLMTSIEPGGLRGDLADRLLPINLTVISDDRRRSERDVWEKYEAIQAEAFGGLLDLTAAALAELPGVVLDKLPRMADFAYLCAAIDKAAGIGALDRYMDTRLDVASNVIEGDSFATFVRDFVMKQGGAWEGPASELLAQTRRADMNFNNEKSISVALTRITPALDLVGVTVENMGRRRVERTASKDVKKTWFRIAAKGAEPKPKSVPESEPY